MRAKTIDIFESDVRGKLEELDGKIAEIAERSHRAERAALEAGQVAPARGPRDVVGERFQMEARDAERDARLRIEILADQLIDSARREVTEVAPRDTLENIAFVLDHATLSEGEFVTLYGQYSRFWAIERVLAGEAAKRSIGIDRNVASVVLDQADSLKLKAAQAAFGRWSDGRYRSHSVTPAAIAAASVADEARQYPSDFFSTLCSDEAGGGAEQLPDGQLFTFASF